MVGVLYTEGCMILSLTAGMLNVAHSSEKIQTLVLYTSINVTEQNVATIVKLCSPVFSNTLLILSCLNTELRDPAWTQHN